MSGYVGINDKAMSIKEIYVGVDGVARRVTKGYVGVDGIARLIYSSSPIVPGDYKQLVALNKKSTNYKGINTGVKVTNKMRVEVVSKIDKISNIHKSASIFESYGTKASDYFVFTPLNDEYTSLSVWRYSPTKTPKDGTYFEVGDFFGSKHTFGIDFLNRKMIFDNNVYNVSSLYNYVTYSQTIFCFQNPISKVNNVDTISFTGYVYEIKIYTSNVLINHFVPCIEKSTNYLGMYDVISNNFISVDTDIFEPIEE